MQLTPGNMPSHRQEAGRRVARTYTEVRMSAIIPMAQGLFDLANDLIRRHQPIESARVLRRLIASPDISPSLAAEANRLLAAIHFQRAEYDRARDSLGAAIESDPNN